MLDKAGQGIGSFLELIEGVLLPSEGGATAFGTSVLVLGLAFDTVDGWVVDSDAELDALEPFGLVSSQVSQPSMSLGDLGDVVESCLPLGVDVEADFLVLVGVSR